MEECIREGTKLVQAIANTLFNFPSTETNDGPIVQLPPPTTKLPREKHVRSSFYFSLSPIPCDTISNGCCYSMGFRNLQHETTHGYNQFEMQTSDFLQGCS